MSKSVIWNVDLPIFIKFGAVVRLVSWLMRRASIAEMETMHRLPMVTKSLPKNWVPVQNIQTRIEVDLLEVSELSIIFIKNNVKTKKIEYW